MASYLVLFLCRACVDVHRLADNVELNGLSGGGCIEDIYNGGLLPAALEWVLDEVNCPTTGPVKVDRRSVYIYQRED
jgi:hypothetical protein